jgi:hypothetical protein
MSYGNPQHHYKDDNLIVSSSAVIHEGERIPIESIKRVYSAPDNGPLGLLSGFVTPSYIQIVLEIGFLKRKRVIFREVYVGSDPAFGASRLSRSNVLSGSPKTDFKWIEEKCAEGHTTIAALRTLPGSKQFAIDELERALARWEKHDQIIEAVQSAMASH